MCMNTYGHKRREKWKGTHGFETVYKNAYVRCTLYDYGKLWRGVTWVS